MSKIYLSRLNGWLASFPLNSLKDSMKIKKADNIVQVTNELTVNFIRNIIRERHQKYILCSIITYA